MQESAVNPNRVPYLGAVILGFLRSRFSVKAALQRAQTRRELRALHDAEDRTLKDVGLTRDQVKLEIRRSDLPF